MKTTDPPIVVEQTFNNPINEVWEAITQLDKMKGWFFENITSFKPIVDFETQFIVQVEDRVFPHQWKLLEVEPNRRIKYDWKYEGYSGRSTVSFELSEVKNQTHLTLTCTILENFPEDIPEFKRESCIDGWNYFIKNRLKDYLEK